MTRDSEPFDRISIAGWEMPTTLHRWLVFNVVGALGFLVQLAVLMLLMGRFRWGFAPATVLAVEAAVVHNFVWHERWTWADRGNSGWLAVARRFLRFNLTNGALSIVGNLVFMRIFLGTLPVNYVTANALAITACSILNYIISDRLVFKGAASSTTVRAHRTQP